MLRWNRRQFLSGLLATASAGVATPALASPLRGHAAPQANAAARPSATSAASAPSATSCPPRLDDGDDHGLQELLPEGLHFGRWRVVSVLPVKLGGVPVVLESSRGERFQVDILRRDHSTRARRGISDTHKYSLFLFNRGQGDTPTQEDHGLAVLWLAALLRPREHTQPTAALLTQRERTQRFPRGKFNALTTTVAQRREPAEAPAPPASEPETPAARSSDPTPA